MLKERAKGFVQRMRLHFGLISAEELYQELMPERDRLINKFNPEDREEVRDVFRGYDDLKTMATPDKFLAQTKRVAWKMEQILKKYDENHFDEDTKYELGVLAGVDGLYTPQAGVGWGLHITPYALFSHFYENHWAVRAAIEIVLTEIINDGFQPVYEKKVSESRSNEIDQILKDMDVKMLRVLLLRDFLIFQNALLLPKTNKFPRGVTGFERLVMDRALPVWNKSDERLAGWSYWTSNTSMFYPKDKLLHLFFPSVKLPDIGCPTMAPIVTDLETDVLASCLNRTVMDKAGMIGLVIMTESPEQGGVIGKNVGKETRRLINDIRSQFSGVNAADSILVSNYIKKVEKISKVGDHEASFREFRQDVAKMICILLKVPPEKIAVPRSPNFTYQAASVEDVINAAFENAVEMYCELVDGFISDYVLPLKGITECRIKANNRFGVFTLSSARAGKLAAETGPLFSLNETRNVFYKLPSLPPWDERGWLPMDNSLNRDKESTPLVPIPKNEKEAKKLAKISSSNTNDDGG